MEGGGVEGWRKRGREECVFSITCVLSLLQLLAATVEMAYPTASWQRCPAEISLPPGASAAWTSSMTALTPPLSTAAS